VESDRERERKGWNREPRRKFRKKGSGGDREREGGKMSDTKS
jgi:hypothetical protein